MGSEGIKTHVSPEAEELMSDKQKEMSRLRQEDIADVEKNGYGTVESLQGYDVQHEDDTDDHHLRGNVNGHKVDLYLVKKNGDYITGFVYGGTIDGVELSNEQATALHKKIYLKMAGKKYLDYLSDSEESRAENNLNKKEEPTEEGSIGTENGSQGNPPENTEDAKHLAQKAIEEILNQ